MSAREKPEDLHDFEHRVLVVDDEQDTVEMVLRILRGHYRAVGSNTAAEALEWLEGERFDAVLVDQRLRDGTGTAVLSRCSMLHPLCRRIAMSGQPEMGDLLAAINVAHVSRFLMKPFSGDGLLAMMADVMREYEAERAELEKLLIEHSTHVGAKQLVAPRRGGRRTRGRGRPAHWPPGTIVQTITAEDPTPLVDLFDPDLELVLASLQPDRVLVDEEAREWAAEVELRLVTRLRDTDQAFRLSDDQFVVAFARTTRDGCLRACRRLGDHLRGGLRIHMTTWPEGAVSTDPYVVVDKLLAR
ncbi:MAG TPA: response regulator [Kofleriaceae bacterium]|nr:response regulator [Kofleriaceae bacterium]